MRQTERKRKKKRCKNIGNSEPKLIDQNLYVCKFITKYIFRQRTKYVAKEKSIGTKKSHKNIWKFVAKSK